MKLRGLLADVNVSGYMAYLQLRLVALGFWPVFVELGLDLATFNQVGLAEDANDRIVWNFCQREGWVLFTENRNHKDEDSLNAVLEDSFRSGNLPVVTLANKSRFVEDREYANRIAADVADVLYEIATMGYEAPPRVYVPR